MMAAESNRGTRLDLHLEIEGEGPTLILLHGWGLHGGVWESTATVLARDYRVVRVDLPGFGASRSLPSAYTAEALADAVARAVPERATWIGWSLGGLVALAAAARGASVEKLVLVGATPRFVQGPDWPHAIAPQVLADFAAELKTDYQATVLRFLALQARGSERAREELRTLRERVFARGEPTLAALSGGLDMLRDSDLRASLPTIRQAALVIHGERDVLVPVAAAQSVVSRLPNGRLAAISGAGHAPFLSHPDAFTERLVSFLHE